MTSPTDDPNAGRDEPTRDPWARPDPTSPAPPWAPPPPSAPWAPPPSSAPWAPPPPPSSSSDPYRFGPPGPNPFGYPAAAQSGPSAPDAAHPSATSGYGQPPSPWPHQSAPSAYPAPPPGAPYPQPAGTSGKAIAGLVLGILAAVLFFLTVFDLPLIVLGIVFSSLGLAAARRGRGGRGIAVTGLILSIIGAVAATAFLVFIVNRTQSCADKYDRNSSAYDVCVREGR